MKEATQGFERIKDMLKKDKNKVPIPLLKQVKSDLFVTLSQFFDVLPEDINLNYKINDKNEYQFIIAFSTKRTKKINYF